MWSFKRGITHIGLPLVLLGLLLILSAVPIRKNLHANLNKVAWNFGIDLNNLTKDSYVAFINDQEDDFLGARQAIFLNKNVSFKDVAAAPNQVLGQTSDTGAKWIEVDISDQKLYMKEGASTVGNFAVSTGKWYPTPQGEWKIWTKLRYTRMRGGSRALGTFYDLPNVPYTMYYYKGYGIHGAYWHNNFGQPMSHGCVNMKPEEAGIVFNWAQVGTRVVVHR